MKKAIALLLAVLLLFGIVACAAQTQNPETPKEPDTQTPETPPAEEDTEDPAPEQPAKPLIGNVVSYDPNQPINDGEDIDIEFWYWSGGSNLFQMLADAYMEVHPNVHIELVENPWDDYWTKLPLTLQGNDGPAIFNMHNGQHDNMIGYMAPYDIPVEDIEAEFTGAAGHVIDGNIYYTDYGLMTATMYYNLDMWEAAGLTESDIPKRGMNSARWRRSSPSVMKTAT